jgi:hypothetical protein
VNQALLSPDLAKHADLISRYEQRKMRVFRDSLKELKALQRERAAKIPSGKTLTQTASVAATPMPDPADGFVFSEPKTMTAQAAEIEIPQDDIAA